jgi:hypothetical protein
LIRIIFFSRRRLRTARVALCINIASLAVAQDDGDAKVRGALESAAGQLQRGDARAALDSLATIDAVEPDNPWLWYYRGNAHGLLGDPRQAMKDYSAALSALVALGDPDPQLAQTIQVARRDARRDIFNLFFQTGLAFDSNVTFGGDGATATFITDREDGKFASRFQWDYVPMLTDREALTVGGRLAHAWHFAVEEFNYQDYGAYIRYSRKLTDPWRFDLQYDYDITYLGNQPFLSNHAFSPWFTYQWTACDARFQPDHTAVAYRIEARDFLFHTDSNLDRDGYANSVGLSQTFRLQPIASRDWVWTLLTGYRFESVATEGSEFDRFVNVFHLGLTIPMVNPWLPKKECTFRFNATGEMDNYRNRSIFDKDDGTRDDLITVLGAVISQQLIDDPQGGELILHVIVNWTDADSDVRTSQRADPFTYDKLVAGFQLEWRF